MGSDRHYAEEGPAHRVEVDGFWIDRHQVTNEQFAAFVAATGYVTVAERPLAAADFPGAPPENLVPGSLVFRRTGRPGRPAAPEPVVGLDAGSLLASPGGPGSGVDGRSGTGRACGATRTPRPTRPGPARRCRPRRSGSWPRGAAWTARPTSGASEPEAPGDRLANYWHGDFPYRPEPGYGATTPGRVVPGQRLRAARHGRATSGSGRPTGTPRRTRRRQPVLRRAQPARRHPRRRASTRRSRSSRCRARW